MAKKTSDAAEAVEVKQESHTFGKEQLLASDRYDGKKDIVNAILENGKEYTTETVDRLVENYMKGKVK
jgi:nitrogen fixation/metabolism regulation signal transduction histidine kinase